METDVIAGLERLGRILEARGERFRLVVVGGAALRLRGIISRRTEDVDVIGTVDDAGNLVPVGTPIPDPLRAGIALVARDLELGDDWLNMRIEGQLEGVGPPPGILARVEWSSTGGLVLGLAGRLDLIALKLYAAVDHWRDGRRLNKHRSDLVMLGPSEQEWQFAVDWVTAQDGSEGWNTLVWEVAADVRQRR
jgi:hypothetical protein